MMTKLVLLTKKSIFFYGIRIWCWIIFKVISFWNEIMGFMRCFGIGGKAYCSLKDYKDKFSGKRCFIIAMGPSLTIADLEKLKGEYTFGMNSIVKVYKDTEFRPTWYGIQDHLVYQSIGNEIFNYYEYSNNVFVADRIKWHFKIGKNWNIFPLNMAYHAYDKWFKQNFYAKFSNNIFKLVYCGFSITYSIIEIAVYMGFSEIYLIGADCSFYEGQNLHFAEHGVCDKCLDTAAIRNIAGYTVAKNYAEKNNIKIYNATRGGMLEVFPRVDLDELLNEEYLYATLD